MAVLGRWGQRWEEGEETPSSSQSKTYSVAIFSLHLTAPPPECFRAVPAQLEEASLHLVSSGEEGKRWVPGRRPCQGWIEQMDFVGRWEVGEKVSGLPLSGSIRAGGIQSCRETQLLCHNSLLQLATTIIKARPPIPVPPASLSQTGLYIRPIPLPIISATNS